MRELVITLAVSVIVSAAVTLWPRATFDAAGWRWVMPGSLLRFGVVVGTALTVFTAWVLLFVGSRRADAEEQLRLLTWGHVGFAVATLLLCAHGWRVRRLALRWRGDELVWRRHGVELARRFADIVRLTRHPLRGVVIHFADGARLPVDPYATHALALLQAANTRPR